MDKGKIVIVALVVIGMMFAFGLVTNLAPKVGETKECENIEDETEQKECENRTTSKSVSEYDTSGWVCAVGSLMSYFSPKLDRKRLKHGAGCMVTGAGYKFVNSNMCTIDIKKLPDNADDDIQNATLQIGKGVNVRLPYPKGKQPSNKTGLPMLTIIYKPEGHDRATKLCAGTDEVRLVAQKKGGTLKMTCTGCSAQRPVMVELK